jgi:hypothetical protein
MSMHVEGKIQLILCLTEHCMGSEGTGPHIVNTVTIYDLVILP